MEKSAKKGLLAPVFGFLGAMVSLVLLLALASFLVSQGSIPEGKMGLTVLLVLGISAFVAGRISRSSSGLVPIVASLLPGVLLFLILLGVGLILGDDYAFVPALPKLGVVMLGGFFAALLGGRRKAKGKKRP